MKTLKLLNKKNLLIILFFLLFGSKSHSQEVIDIWNLEANPEKNKSAIDLSPEEKKIPQNTIYEMQSQRENNFNIEEEQNLSSKISAA